MISSRLEQQHRLLQPHHRYSPSAQLPDDETELGSQHVKLSSQPDLQEHQHQRTFLASGTREAADTASSIRFQYCLALHRRLPINQSLLSSVTNKTRLQSWHRPQLAVYPENSHHHYCHGHPGMFHLARGSSWELHHALECISRKGAQTDTYHHPDGEGALQQAPGTINQGDSLYNEIRNL